MVRIPSGKIVVVGGAKGVYMYVYNISRWTRSLFEVFVLSFHSLSSLLLILRGNNFTHTMMINLTVCPECRYVDNPAQGRIPAVYDEIVTNCRVIVTLSVRKSFFCPLNRRYNELYII